MSFFPIINPIQLVNSYEPWSHYCAQLNTQKIASAFKNTCLTLTSIGITCATFSSFVVLKMESSTIAHSVIHIMLDAFAHVTLIFSDKDTSHQTSLPPLFFLISGVKIALALLMIRKEISLNIHLFQAHKSLQNLLTLTCHLYNVAFIFYTMLCNQREHDLTYLQQEERTLKSLHLLPPFAATTLGDKLFQEKVYKYDVQQTRHLPSIVDPMQVDLQANASKNLIKIALIVSQIFRILLLAGHTLFAFTQPLITNLAWITCGFLLNEIHFPFLMKWYGLKLKPPKDLSPDPSLSSCTNTEASLEKNEAKQSEKSSTDSNTGDKEETFIEEELFKVYTSSTNSNTVDEEETSIEEELFKAYTSSTDSNTADEEETSIEEELFKAYTTYPTILEQPLSLRAWETPFNSIMTPTQIISLLWHTCSQWMIMYANRNGVIPFYFQVQIGQTLASYLTSKPLA